MIETDKLIKLNPDNFTSLGMTPWAGKAIAQKYKSAYFKNSPEVRIGESWEFSCDPKLPSRLQGYNLSLLELVQRFPKEILSRKIAGLNSEPTCEILIKIINADFPLSLQIHPTDNDQSLGEGECGKPESWYVLDHEDGAGIYLGFKNQMSKEELRAILAMPDAAKNILQFVPVKKGDYFEIDPKVPHAIGPGVTLLEPQRVLFGKSGKTFRMWDWGRKYDSEGKLDMEAGHPRELHLEETMQIIEPANLVGDIFLSSIKKRATYVNVCAGVDVEYFPANQHYQLYVFRVKKGSKFEVNINDGYGAYVHLEGELNFISVSNKVTHIVKGESALIPAQSIPALISALENSEFAIVVPAHSNLTFGIKHEKK